VKKLICCFYLCLTIAFLVGQDGWAIKYGIGYSSFRDSESEFRFVKLVGLSKGWKLMDKFSLGTELLFSDRGSKMKNVYIWKFFENTACKCNVDYSALYAELPLLLKYRLVTKKKYSLQVYAGFTYKIAFLDIHSSKIYVKECIIGDPDKSEYNYRENPEEGPLNSGFDFALGYNVNYSFLHIEMRYCRALHEHGWIGKIRPYNRTKRTHAYFIIFGIVF
jgi:hypothetical protein